MTTARRNAARSNRRAWPTDGMAYGGDYNPDQWPEEVWREDMALMRRAGVNLVSLGVFSWARSEPSDGQFDFDWLDRVMDMLADNGIGASLATPTAAPPMWLWRAHPEIGTVSAEGVRTGPGGRLGWSPSSPVFRRYALRIVRAIGERYRDHPALRMWHVGNEFGNENSTCYSAESEQAFREWLRKRYDSVEEVNRRWGTAFWGHIYGDFEEIPAPRAARTGHNPSLLLDYRRFTSDALLDHYRAEREVLREVAPEVPATTNFMILGAGGAADYREWAQEVDLVANDHYTMARDPERHRELAFSADRTRGVAGGKPWLLMEHAAGAVNWQPRNRAKDPGEMRRDSLAHIARGADGAMFFQWRQSTHGGEQFHSGMVPHAGPESRLHREVVELGDALGRIKEVAGSTVEHGAAAILWDQQSVWAYRSGRKPTEALDIAGPALRLHSALSRRHISVDVVAPQDDLSGYSLVVVPMLFMLSEEAAARLDRFVSAGGHVLVTYLSAIVDENNGVLAGGYPARLRDLLGIRVEEFRPLLEGERVALDDGATAVDWSEHVTTVDAEVLARYREGPLTGSAAVTLARRGEGTAQYLSAQLDDVGFERLVDALVERTGLPRLVDAPPSVEAVRRRNGESSWLFLINHGAEPAAVEASGFDLLRGREYGGVLRGGDVAVVREHHTQTVQ